MTSDDSFRSTATTHDELESGITPGGTSGAFRDVLAKDHARRGKPPLHFADMDAGERIERAKALGESIVIGGSNYGQGSSREHAALVPMYLGVRAVIAKSFARIHAANLINSGILPLTFKNAGDYDKISEGDALSLTGIFAGMDKGKITLKDETNGEEATLVCSFTERQKNILKAGGLLAFATKN